MPTITTTVTSAEASGQCTTVTTTEATPAPPSSSTQIAHVQGMLDAWGAGTLTAPETLAKFYSASCTCDYGSKVGVKGTDIFKVYTGHAGIAEFVGNLAATFDFTAVDTQLSGVNNMVSLVFTYSATIKSTGNKIADTVIIQSIKFNGDNKVESVKFFFDDVEELIDAFVSPEADPGIYVDVVAVTGCGGYIASEVIKQLLEQGYHVKGTARKVPEPGTELASAKYGHLYRMAAALPGKFEMFSAYLAEGDTGFDECFKGCKYVFHVASPLGLWQKDPYEEVVNPAVEGCRNAIKFAAKNGVKRVVLTSSVWSTANLMVPQEGINVPKNGKLYTEDDWMPNTDEAFVRSTENPFGAYGASKPIAEKAAWEEAEKLGVDLVTILPGVVFGPPVAKGSITVDIFAGMFKESNPLMVAGMFPAVDVRDIAKAHICAAVKPEAKGRYQICHQDSVDQKWFDDLTVKHFPQFGKVSTCSDAVKPCMDNSKGVELIGPLIDMERTFLDTTRALLAIGDLCADGSLSEKGTHSPFVEPNPTK